MTYVRLIGVVVVFGGLAIYALLGYQDRNYAENYFSFIDYERVLESRKWHNEGFGCTYAIVSLVDAAPINPYREWIAPSDWYQTPVRFKPESEVELCRNIICECENELTANNYQRLARALSEPGSFYYYVGSHQPPHDPFYQATILVYSSDEKIAARIRFGD